MAPSGPAFRRLLTLAEGGMGVIELARRQEGRFTRLYALKRPHPQLRRDADLRAMFLDEGRVAGLIRHANVVSVLDVGEDADGPYLVMDYIEGVSAATLIQQAAARDERLPLPLGLSIAAQVARGLHAAHELRGLDGKPLGLVHRDVSPQNIVIGYDGVARVTDFGIVKAYGNVSRTSTGLLKGNIGYMSPEQLRFREPDRRSDLFSLGVVLYELLAGRRLYHEEEANAAARRVLEEPPPDIGELRNDVTPELTGLMFELLAKDPGMRPSDAQEVARRLEAMLRAFEAEVGPFDLAAYIGQQFSDRRDQMARTIAEAEHAAEAAQTEESAQSPPTPPSPSSRRITSVALVGGVAALAAGALALSRWLRDEPAKPRAGAPIAGGVLGLGAWHTCASRGRVLDCWGKNNEGQLGDGGTINHVVRRQVLGVSDVVSVIGGEFHTIALRGDGTLFGWGLNKDGQLGSIALPRTLKALPIPGVLDVRAVAAGDTFTCVLRTNGRVGCLGAIGERRDAGVALGLAEVPGITDAVEIAAGAATMCARLASGRILCWGRNDRGQLGDGTTSPSASPVPVAGVTDATQVSVGDLFACALRSAGEVLCWGDNDTSQLGLPDTLELRPRPAPVPGLRDITQIALMGSAACALVRGGSVLCWGRGDWGNLGDGTSGSNAIRAEPRPVLGLDDVAFIAAGSVHMCARRLSGELVCWGDNANGQIGDGTLERRARPVSVAAQP